METFRYAKATIVLFAILMLVNGASAQQKTLPAYISAKHQQVLQRWLKREPELRVATDDDCGRCGDDIGNQKKISGRDYHPYYAVGDFNGDGREDFAVALIEIEESGERAMQKFVVAVFNAPFSSRRAEPSFMKDNLNLRDGGMFFGPPKSKPFRLSIGLFANDSGLTLIPRGRRYLAK